MRIEGGLYRATSWVAQWENIICRLWKTIYRLRHRLWKTTYGLKQKPRAWF